MKVSIAALGLLATLTALSAIPVNDSRTVPSGGFSVWAQAQRPESCYCTSAMAGGVECLPIVQCLPIGRCDRVC
jgi:hypothetical protein